MSWQTQWSDNVWEQFFFSQRGVIKGGYGDYCIMGALDHIPWGPQLVQRHTYISKSLQKRWVQITIHSTAKCCEGASLFLSNWHGTDSGKGQEKLQNLIFEACQIYVDIKSVPLMDVSHNSLRMLPAGVRNPCEKDGSVSLLLHLLSEFLPRKDVGETLLNCFSSKYSFFNKLPLAEQQIRVVFSQECGHKESLTRPHKWVFLWWCIDVHVHFANTAF